VPLSCCDEAATYIIKALGGEDVARQAVGGVKWWQVRGVNGLVVSIFSSYLKNLTLSRVCYSVDAEWLTMKNDWREAKKRHKMRQDQARMGFNAPTAPTTSPPESLSSDNNAYDKDMDAMRCIIYLHGGTVTISLYHN
jgi:hypothetical protein